MSRYRDQVPAGNPFDPGGDKCTNPQRLGFSGKECVWIIDLRYDIHDACGFVEYTFGTNHLSLPGIGILANLAGQGHRKRPTVS